MRLLMTCCSLLSILAAAGCASTRSEVDGAYMARVERAARVTGIEVVWINPPRRAVADAPN